MTEQIIKILNEIRPEFDFSDYDNYIDSGLLDSFDIISLVSSLDEEFGISIDGTDITPDNFSTLEAIKQLVDKYKSKD
jgi:acyl carrier protein